ncbi:MAG: DegV family protein [Clostridia bacterium]|nr:DegV family protein [Clostridia bacterium]
MSDFILSCCSTADLTKQHFEDRNIKYICFHYFLDGIHYIDDLGQTIPFNEFYKKMQQGSETRTSQVNIDEYYDYFESLLKTGKDVLHITLSSGLSGSYNSARIAAADLREKFPQQKLYIVDSLGASSGYGLFVDKLADLRDAGKDIDYIYNWANNNKLKMHHWFFSTDLSFYVKGGRISKTAGLFGTVLKICPVLNMDANGKLIPRKKVRGKNNAITEIIEEMKLNAENGLEYNNKCYICHSACLDDAEKVSSLIVSNFPKLENKPQIFDIGTTIGCHSGPGTVAVFFWGKEREL